MKIQESYISLIHTNGYLEYEKSIGFSDFDRKISRRKYANFAVEYWISAEGSDSHRLNLERGLVMEFIKHLFSPNSLFPSPEYSKNEQENIMRELISVAKKPHSLKVIGSYLSDKSLEIRKSFLYDGILIIAIDEKFEANEILFLENSASEFKIERSEMDAMINEIKEKLSIKGDK
ncbi:MAG: hypothetical protein H7A24_16785 [Leptospiraceae bacterium]|nr:hypothetical protein [Leptospiraceae bacterium]MCP5513547.1 hypothetical protein [Leptospiraceae bacterium]